MASFVRPDEATKPQPRLSKWEKADIRTERRSRASKHELMRENIADKLRCPLCFCLPCVVIVFILLILIGIYVVRPYVQGKVFSLFQVLSSVCGTVCRLTACRFQNRKHYCNLQGRQASYNESRVNVNLPKGPHFCLLQD